MELVEVEITSQAITARYGTLSTGDVLRTDAEFAKHLVEDCGAAKYSKAQKPAESRADPPPGEITAPIAKPAKAKK